jgi:hypothetical protein
MLNLNCLQKVMISQEGGCPSYPKLIDRYSGRPKSYEEVINSGLPLVSEVNR